jgi:hypothetical protein
VGLDLVDLALQALDGTKIEANAAHDRTHDSHELVRLLDRTEKSILELEAMNESSDDLPPPRLPERLQKAQVLRQQVRNAMKRLSEDKAIKQTNLTDEDARLMKGRGGIIVGYNAQAMVSPIKQDAPERGGMMITAADVVCTASDCAQLVPMLKQAEKTTSKRAAITLADGGYHTAANLEAGERRSQTLVMTERYQRELKNPYFKDQFAYDDETDSYYCPCGHRLHFRGMRHDHRTSRRYRVYTASRTACRTCKAFGTCTKDAHGGRALWIGSSDVLIRRHRQWMGTPEARQLYARRQQLCEPVFGILKDRMAARKFLLRGLENVRAEFSLLATTFNLRTLCRFWGAMGNRKWVSIQQLDQQIAAILVTSGPTPVLA